LRRELDAIYTPRISIGAIWCDPDSRARNVTQRRRVCVRAKRKARLLGANMIGRKSRDRARRARLISRYIIWQMERERDQSA